MNLNLLKENLYYYLGISMYVDKKTKDKYDELFWLRIREYNHNREIHNHYVKLDNDRLMVIEWIKGHWTYNVYMLEKV